MARKIFHSVHGIITRSGIHNIRIPRHLLPDLAQPMLPLFRVRQTPKISERVSPPINNRVEMQIRGFTLDGANLNLVKTLGFSPCFSVAQSGEKLTKTGNPFPGQRSPHKREGHEPRIDHLFNLGNIKPHYTLSPESLAPRACSVNTLDLDHESIATFTTDYGFPWMKFQLNTPSRVMPSYSIKKNKYDDSVYLHPLSQPTTRLGSSHSQSIRTIIYITDVPVIVLGTTHSYGKPKGAGFPRYEKVPSSHSLSPRINPSLRRGVAKRRPLSPPKFHR